MNKIRIFLSSRVNSTFKNLDSDFTLTELRQYIRESFEDEVFLGENVFEVIINENSFNNDFSKDAFDNCLDKMRSCHIIIILYNGEAGWSAENVPTNGICHDEFLVAMKEFSGLTWAMDISSYFILSETKKEKKKNNAFSEDVNRSFRHMEKISTPQTVESLKKTVLKQIKGYVLEAFQQSFKTRKEQVSGNNVFGSTLDWSKLNYSERQEAISIQIKLNFDSIPALTTVLKAFHAIPDNMSVADARNLIGRPFIKEHELVKNKVEKSGVIHFIAVYGNATEIQVKNLVGYPDLTVIKGTFGFYLWEKNTHVQMFFFTKCINPQTIKIRLSQLINWLNGSGEQPRIVVRANARFSILDAINKAEKMEGLK
jgi:hypothetical protein